MNGLGLPVASQLWIAYSSWILLNLDSFLVFFFFFLLFSSFHFFIWASPLYTFRVLGQCPFFCAFQLNFISY